MIDWLPVEQKNKRAKRERAGTEVQKGKGKSSGQFPRFFKIES